MKSLKHIFNLFLLLVVVFSLYNMIAKPDLTNSIPSLRKEKILKTSGVFYNLIRNEQYDAAKTLLLQPASEAELRDFRSQLNQMLAPSLLDLFTDLSWEITGEVVSSNKSSAVVKWIFTEKMGDEIGLSIPVTFNMQKVVKSKDWKIVFHSLIESVTQNLNSHKMSLDSENNSLAAPVISAGQIEQSSAFPPKSLAASQNEHANNTYLTLAGWTPGMKFS